MDSRKKGQTVVVLLALSVISCGFLLAQDLVFLGRYDDFRILPKQDKQPHEFTFVRLIYNGRIPFYYKNWYTDFPKGERQLIPVVQRLTGIDISPLERALPIHHPDIFSYPFIYSVEAGQMLLNADDARRMREYVDRGGFWMIDDFWGSFEWRNFETQMKKVFPEREIIDLPLDHPIFHSFFDVEKIIQIPNSGYVNCMPCPTWEQDGIQPFVKAILDDAGRIVVLINFNTDLMDASEWADLPKYPNAFSEFTYKMFTNTLVYAMSH